MAGYGKVRQLVTGDSGMDTFIREVRTSLGELHDTVGTTTSSNSRVIPWDTNHAFAFSFSNPSGTTFIRNEGSAGPSYALQIGGTTPRFGFPSPVGGALEFASETTNPSYVYGAGSFPTLANNYSIEWMFYTHFAPYDIAPWDGYVCLEKSAVFYSSIPCPGPPSTFDTVFTTSGLVATNILPTKAVQLPTCQWNHVMFTASSTAGKKVYLNGAIVGANTNTTATNVNTNDWYFGGRSSTLYKYYGAIARFAYSTTARNQAYAIQVTNAMRGWL